MEHLHTISFATLPLRSIFILKPSRHRKNPLFILCDQLKSLCSRVISDSGCSPTQARKMLVKAARCLARALITGVPGGVKGALTI